MSEATPHLFSASQVTLYRECARKWGWRYIAGIKTPQHPAAALGTEVDDTQLQPYLRDGRPLDLTRASGEIAEAGLAHLPKPGTPGMQVQRHFLMPSFSTKAFAYQGYLDLWLPQGGLPDMPTKVGRIPEVSDFKTTGNITAKWVKTPKTLAYDVQAQLYATWAMHETGARTVDLVWIYFQTRGTRKSKRVHLRVHGQEVAEQFHAIDRTAVEMFNVRTNAVGQDPAEYPLTLPPNADMCDEFGGCPYQSKCNLSPLETQESKARKEVSDVITTAQLLADLQRRSVPETALAQMPVVGINPPEKDLPPAPPEAPAIAPVVAEAKPAKRTRGPNKPKAGADLVKDMEANALAVPTPEEVFPNLGTCGDVPMCPQTYASRGIDFPRLAQSVEAIQACLQSIVENLKGAA